MSEKSLEEGNLLSVITTSDKFQVEIDWDITWRCNYSCTYCESYDNSSPNHFRNLDEYIKVLKYLKKYFNNKKPTLSLLGGEPMLYKNWDKILNESFKLEFLPKITTNLSINYKTLKEKVKNLQPKECIDVSWHTQFASNDDMVQKIKLIHSTNHLRTISILGDKRYWNKVIEAYNSVKFTNKTEITYIQDLASDKNIIANKLNDYTDEEISFINSTKQDNLPTYKTIVTYKNGKIIELYGLSDFFHNNLTNFKNMKCEVGQTRIHIKPNGDVYPSACLLNYPKSKMGNIYEFNLKKPNKPITCPFNFCGCGPDTRINKYE